MSTKKQLSLLLILLGFLLLGSVVLATPTATSIERYVIGGGGGNAEAGDYILAGTIGQAVVGANSAAPFELCSGFWCGADATHHLYLPLVLKN